ncbi:MAG: linear amide C-N hydrolase [Ferruginibacter sp.]
MKKGFAFLVCLCFLFFQQAIACTTFFINKNGQLVFGRNYDWISDAGMVCTNLRGLGKTSVTQRDGSAISWVSKYGSITFNQYGKEFPTGGMNEKGLVVELMWADGSQYPKADARPAIGVLQWIQYQLDNNATIEEVIASDAKIRISRDNPPLHYLIADANGNAATIEFFNGKIEVHQGKDLPFPVLTNNPYTQSAKTAVDANVLKGDTSFSFRDNSLQRFTKACSMVQQYQTATINKPVIDYAFDILNRVAQEDFTKWSIVYDIKNKKVFFKTADYQDVKSFSFNSFDFNCTATARVINMNQQMRGPVDKNFQPFSAEINRSVMTKAVEESKSQVTISDDEKEGNIAYAKKIKCKD